MSHTNHVLTSGTQPRKISRFLIMVTKNTNVFQLYANCVVLRAYCNEDAGDCRVPHLKPVVFTRWYATRYQKSLAPEI